MDDFFVSIDDVAEVWDLADRFQLKGLKYFCMGSLERGVCNENVSEIQEEAEDLMCPCDELERICHAYLECMS